VLDGDAWRTLRGDIYSTRRCWRPSALALSRRGSLAKSRGWIRCPGNLAPPGSCDRVGRRQDTSGVVHRAWERCILQRKVSLAGCEQAPSALDRVAFLPSGSKTPWMQRHTSQTGHPFTGPILTGGQLGQRGWESAVSRHRPDQLFSEKLLTRRSRCARGCRAEASAVQILVCLGHNLACVLEIFLRLSLFLLLNVDEAVAPRTVPCAGQYRRDLAFERVGILLEGWLRSARPGWLREAAAAGLAGGPKLARRMLPGVKSSVWDGGSQELRTRREDGDQKTSGFHSSFLSRTVSAITPTCFS